MSHKCNDLNNRCLVVWCKKVWSVGYHDGKHVFSEPRNVGLHTGIYSSA